MISKNVEDIKAIINYPSEVAKTSRGLVEYAFRGEGPVVVTIHGGPGGYDQGLLLGETFRSAGFRILSISRPGYLRTPLETGRTFEEQADAIAALLDTLGLDKILLAHGSAGGPTGYTFARRHPDRVIAQIAIDSVCMRYVVHVTKMQEALFMSKFGLWLTNFSLNHFPKATLKQLYASESSLNRKDIEKIVGEVIQDPWKLANVTCLMQTAGGDKITERKIGLNNDLEMFAKLDKLPLDGITSPTLIFHGDSDKDVFPEQAEYAHKNIPNSELYWIPKASHIGFFIG